MSERIAARAIAEMQVHADAILARRLTRLRVLCLLLACALGAALLVPHIQFPTPSQASTPPAPAPAYTPPAGSTAAATVQTKRFPTKDKSDVVLYARTRLQRLTGPATISWYFLYTKNPGRNAEPATIGKQKYFAVPAASGGNYLGSNSSYSIMTFADSCVVDNKTPTCALALNALAPGPAKIAAVTRDTQKIYVLGAADIPPISQDCTAIFGRVCDAF